MKNCINLFENKNNFEKIKNVKSVCVEGDLSILDKCELTICIPTYNRPNTLKNTIDSLLQLLPSKISYCVLILDNNPTDEITETHKLILSYEDKKIVYFKNLENIGMFNNWNRCFEICRSEYIAFVHDDDLLKKDYLQYLEKIFPIIQKKKIACLCFPYDRLILNNSKEKSGDEKKKKSLLRDTINKLNFYKLRKIDNRLVYLTGGNIFAMPSCGIIFKRSIVIESGGFDDSRFPTADFEFLIYMMYRYNVYYAHHSVGIYRWECNESLRPETLEHSINNQIEELLEFQKKYLIINYFFGRKIITLKNKEQYSDYSILGLLRRIIFYMFFISDSVDLIGLGNL